MILGMSMPNGELVRAEKALETMTKWAVVLAERYPHCGFAYGVPYKEEYTRVTHRLGLPTPEGEMEDNTCIHCEGKKVSNSEYIGYNQSIYNVQMSSPKWTRMGPEIMTDRTIKMEVDSLELG